MNTSGVFTTHKYRIPLQDQSPLRLVIFGDVHRDSPNFAHNRWEEFLDYAKGLPKSTRFLGMGDYIDSMSASERKALMAASFHEGTTVDLTHLAQGKVKTLTNELSFMKGRLIGLINGNHFFLDPGTGINSDQMLAQALGCKYLGVSSFIRLEFVIAKTTVITYDLWAHHGAGGGKRVGGSLNRVDDMRDHAEADVYLMGHDHKKGVWPATPRMQLVNGNGILRVRERQAYLVRYGSFLKSYEDGETSYNVDSCRGPSSLGHVELELTFRRSGGRKPGESRHYVIETRGIA